MLLDILSFFTRRAYFAVASARWRRDFYGFGGPGYTGGRTSRGGEWS